MKTSFKAVPRRRRSLSLPHYVSSRRYRGGACHSIAEWTRLLGDFFSRLRLGHCVFDNLQKEQGLFLFAQVREFLIREGALIVVEDGDLLHRGIEEAPARP